MPAGPPTKYNESLIGVADAYYQECLGVANQMPMVEELAQRLGIHEDTLIEWVKQEDKKELSGTYKKVKSLQKQRLQGLGLFNRVNPTMAIFLLKVNHGFIDTSRQEHTGANGDPIESSTTVTFVPKQLPDKYWEANASNDV